MTDPELSRLRAELEREIGENSLGGQFLRQAEDDLDRVVSEIQDRQRIRSRPLTEPRELGVRHQPTDE